MKENGLTSTGTHLVTIGDTDYSDLIAELKQEEPEAIFSRSMVRKSVTSRSRWLPPD